jgi:cytoskeletal protein CcmA (bactofilin family)
MAETVIGKGIVIDGEISGDEPIVVEGSVKGRIALESTVVVASGGVVEADVESDDIEISGQVTGNVSARDRAEIKSEGRMVGDIRAPRILIADGAGFKGHIDMDVD